LLIFICIAFLLFKTPDKKKKKLISKKDLDQVERSIVRRQQHEQGIFDGRYRTKVVPSGKIYRRKNNSNREEWVK
jgi:hypothetical protein